LGFLDNVAYMNTWQEEIRRYVAGAVQNQLTESSPQADQPAWIRTPLRPHQLSLLAAARALEAKATLREGLLETPQLLTRYGVLADRVGAGKSLVALSLLRDPPVDHAQFTCREGGLARVIGLRHMPDVQEWKAEWRDLSDGFALAQQMFPGDSKRFHSRTSFIIVPHNVIQQWEEYVKTHTNLRIYFVRKTRDCDGGRAGFFRDVFESDAVIVSCTMLRKFIVGFYENGIRFSDIVWSRFFVDEADTITLGFRAGDVTSRFTWFITGSWMNMLFPNGLWSHSVASLPPPIQQQLGNGTVPGVLSRSNIVTTSLSDNRDPRFAALVLRNSDAWIDTSLARPAIIHDTVMCKAPANLSILRGFISAAALEALHAGDTAGALTALGLKTTSKETLVEKVTESLRRDLAQAERTLVFKQESEYSSAAAKAHAIERAEAHITRIKAQLADLESRVATATGSTLCPICYDTPRTTTLTPCCRQAFCLSCLCECVKAKPACPMCRAPITSVQDLLVVGSDGEGGEGGQEAVVETLPTKGSALLKLLETSTPDQRFLVFSAHEASFKGLRDILEEKGIQCELLQGSALRVESLRKRFREGKVRVLCMNARNVGAGINLEAATHIVLYHRMNAELEKQVIGRAVRFERAAELRVVHLVHESETALNGASGSEVIVHV
jgi:SNF2 family DNA or RNA helicase